MGDHGTRFNKTLEPDVGIHTAEETAELIKFFKSLNKIKRIRVSGPAKNVEDFKRDVARHLAEETSRENEHISND